LIVLFESEPVAEATADTVLNNDLISLAWATGCVVAKVVFCVEVNLVACGAVVRLKTLAATFVKVAEAPAAAVKILFKAICRLSICFKTTLIEVRVDEPGAVAESFLLVDRKATADGEVELVRAFPIKRCSRDTGLVGASKLFNVLNTLDATAEAVADTAFGVDLSPVATGAEIALNGLLDCFLMLEDVAPNAARIFAASFVRVAEVATDAVLGVPVDLVRVAVGEVDAAASFVNCLIRFNAAVGAVDAARISELARRSVPIGLVEA
jgi:hypothetical protein